LLFDIVIHDEARAHCRPLRARIARLRAGSCAAAGAHADGFASMLLFVLQLRSAEKPEKSSRISRVTLLQMESGFF
jgi:hypothetical protein